MTGARARLDVLSKHGLSGELLDEAAAGIMELVNRIDGLNRHRFVTQPEILVNWESARNLVTVAPKANPTSVPPSGAGGDVRGAA